MAQVINLLGDALLIGLELVVSVSLTFVVLVRKSVVKLFCSSAPPAYFSLGRIDCTVEVDHTVLSREVDFGIGHLPRHGLTPRASKRWWI